MAVTSLQEQGDQGGDGGVERCVEQVHILCVWFGLVEGAWQYNWRLWKEKALFQIARWSKWRGLLLYQQATYLNTYTLPGATFLAVVYPPPQQLLEEVTTAAFRFLWGTAHFPLAQAAAYAALEEGGLGLRALGPWLAAVYAAANFAGWWEVKNSRMQQTPGLRRGHVWSGQTLMTPGQAGAGHGAGGGRRTASHTASRPP